MATKIQWADETWNPITGCTPCSPGCQNCYAARMAKRLAGRMGYPKDKPFRVTFHNNVMEKPLRWRKARRIFVCSMGDFFHPCVRRSWQMDCFTMMELCDNHTFLLLTKRPGNICNHLPIQWPDRYPNIWLGVTVCNQREADLKIPALLKIPAAVRFVSIEPMLAPVNLRDYFWRGDGSQCTGPLLPSIDWVICGGESGPNARPIHPDWTRTIRDQCQAAGVPFFFKQWGTWSPDRPEHVGLVWLFKNPDLLMYNVGKKKAGRLLDGREWNEIPEGKPIE